MRKNRDAGPKTAARCARFDNRTYTTEKSEGGKWPRKVGDNRAAGVHHLGFRVCIHSRSGSVRFGAARVDTQALQLHTFSPKEPQPLMDWILTTVILTVGVGSLVIVTFRPCPSCQHLSRRCVIRCRRCGHLWD